MRLLLFAGQYFVLAMLYYFLFQVVAVLNRSLSATHREEAARPAGRSRPEAVGRLDLVVLRGSAPESGERFRIGSSSVFLGRASDNQILIADSNASGHHAKVSWSRGQLWIDDLKSRNGTHVNGTRISAPVVLKSGDQIEIGDTAFSVEPADNPKKR